MDPAVYIIKDQFQETKVNVVKFLILRRIERDTTINVHRSSCKLTVILVRF
jgi:hypothetical protein